MSKSSQISNRANDVLNHLDEMRGAGLSIDQQLDFARKELEEMVWQSRERQDPTVQVGRALELVASCVADIEAQLLFRKEILALAATGVQAAPGVALAQVALSLSPKMPERDRIRLHRGILKSIGKTSKGRVARLADKAHEKLRKGKLRPAKAMALANSAFESLLKIA